MHVTTHFWTSHAYYSGRVDPPPALDVEQGLALCGFSRDEHGWDEFARLVDQRASGGCDANLSGDDALRRRAEARCDAGAPVELRSPVVTSNGLEYGLTARSLPLRTLGIAMEPEAAISVVSALFGVSSSAVTSRNRRPEVVAARRVVVHMWRCLSRPMSEMSTALGISRPACSNLLYRGREADLAKARASAASIVSRMLDIHEDVASMHG